MDTRRLTAYHKQFKIADICRVFGEDYDFALADKPAWRAPVKRVALFAEMFFPSFGGASQAVYNTLRYLQQTGREVLVFAPDNAPKQIGPSHVIGLPSVAMRDYPDLRLGLPVAEVTRHLNEFQPDLIHLSGPICFSARAILYGRKRKIPVVGVYESNLPQYLPYYKAGYLKGIMHRWQRYLHNQCDLTLVPSMYTQHALERCGYRHLECWQHGVNEARFNPNRRSQTQREWLLNGRDPASLLCVYVGRLAPEKSIETLLGIAKMPGVALTIIGDGPERSQLESAFQGTGTFFTGYLLGHELAAAFASAEVFVFPSTTETFGLVTVEAMASGLPAVVCNQGGVTDLVVDGYSGYVCAKPETFAQAIQQLRDNPTLRAEMSRCARRTAEQHTWGKVMAELEGHFSRAVTLAARSDCAVLAAT